MLCLSNKRNFLKSRTNRFRNTRLVEASIGGSNWLKLQSKGTRRSAYASIRHDPLARYAIPCPIENVRVSPSSEVFRGAIQIISLIRGTLIII